VDIVRVDRLERLNEGYAHAETRLFTPWENPAKACFLLVREK
jgi:hypothetical protein